jgi:tetratricopeptide (TPR) repeat protein
MFQKVVGKVCKNEECEKYNERVEEFRVVCEACNSQLHEIKKNNMAAILAMLFLAVVVIVGGVFALRQFVFHPKIPGTLMKTAGEGAQRTAPTDDKAELVSRYMQEGEQFYQRGDQDAALQKFRQVLDLDPSFEQAKERCGKTYLAKGIAAHEAGNYQETVNLLSEAINFQNSLTEAYFYRGWAYHEMKEIENAIIDYKKALELNPNPPKYYAQLAWAYYENKNLFDAKRITQEGLTKDAANVRLKELAKVLGIAKR